MQALVADIPKPRSRLFEGAVAISLSVLLGTGIVLMGDLRTLYQSAVLAGLVGIAALVSIPNRRMALVVGWVLVHPLSIEKVFFLGRPLMRDFFPPTIVISASDIFLLLLVASLVYESVVQKRKAWYWPACGLPYALLIVWMGMLLLPHPSTEGVWRSRATSRCWCLWWLCPRRFGRATIFYSYWQLSWLPLAFRPWRWASPTRWPSPLSWPAAGRSKAC